MKRTVSSEPEPREPGIRPQQVRPAALASLGGFFAQAEAQAEAGKSTHLGGLGGEPLVSLHVSMLKFERSGLDLGCGRLMSKSKR